MKFMATPNPGANVDAAAWLMRARPRSISASTRKNAYSRPEMRAEEKIFLCVPANVTSKNPTPNMR